MAARWNRVADLCGKIDTIIVPSIKRYNNINVCTCLRVQRRLINTCVKGISAKGSTNKGRLLGGKFPYLQGNAFLLGKDNWLLAKFCSNNSPDLQTDFADIRLMMQHKLEERKAPSDKVSRQLALLDLLFEHRMQHVDATIIREEASKSSAQGIHHSIHGNACHEGEFPASRHAAISGDLNAKYSYGQLLRLGQAGMDPDPIEAANIFSELAKQGHPYAQFALAGMYYAGSGVKQNFETSYTLFQIAAENGVSQGYNMIGKMYFQGQSVERDYKKAFEYFQKGADKGDIGAYMSLAHCYSNGKGTETDYKKAFEFHMKAAEKSHPPAMFNIGTHYFSGKGVDLDMQKASEFFRKAADLGFSLAQVNLGNMYYHGLGVEKDWNAARRLYKKVAPTNHNARLLLEELEAEMKKAGMELED
eukprot:gene15998-7331_t